MHWKLKFLHIRLNIISVVTKTFIRIQCYHLVNTQGIYLYMTKVIQCIRFKLVFLRLIKLPGPYHTVRHLTLQAWRRHPSPWLVTFSCPSPHSRARPRGRRRCRGHPSSWPGKLQRTVVAAQVESSRNFLLETDTPPSSLRQHGAGQPPNL